VTTALPPIEAERFYRDLEPALARAQLCAPRQRTRAIHAKIAIAEKIFAQTQHPAGDWPRCSVRRQRECLRAGEDSTGEVGARCGMERIPKTICCTNALTLACGSRKSMKRFLPDLQRV